MGTSVMVLFGRIGIHGRSTGKAPNSCFGELVESEAGRVPNQWSSAPSSGSLKGVLPELM